MPAASPATRRRAKLSPLSTIARTAKFVPQHRVQQGLCLLRRQFVPVQCIHDFRFLLLVDREQAKGPHRGVEREVGA